MVERQTERSGARFRAVVYDPKLYPWETVGEQIFGIQHEAFGAEGYPQEVLQTVFTSPDNTAVILNDAGEVAGYYLTVPIGSYDRARRSLNSQIAFGTAVAIRETYRGQGLFLKLLGAMDAALIAKGYTSLEVRARKETGLAAWLEERYTGRIELNEDRSDFRTNTTKRALRWRLQ